MKSKILVSSLAPFMDITGLDGNAVVERKGMSILSIKEDEEATVIASISTTDIDADGDLVYSRGVDLARYQKNPVVCWSHDYSKPPIAKATEINVGEEGIQAKMVFAPTEMGKEMFQLIKGRFLNTCSVGFITHSSLVNGTKEFTDFCKANAVNVGAGCKRLITKWQLLENSMVCIPSNQEALVHAVSTKSMLKDMGIKEMATKDSPVGMPTGCESAPTIISQPMDPAATVNLDMEHNDAVMLMSEDFNRLTEEHDPVNDEKPYPSETSARIHDPGKYSRFRRHNDAFGPGVDVIYGITAAGKAEVQAIRFDASRYDIHQVHAWLEAHHYHPISVHPATGKLMAQDERAVPRPLADGESTGNDGAAAAGYAAGVPTEVRNIPGFTIEAQVQPVAKASYVVVREGPAVPDDGIRQQAVNEIEAEIAMVALGRVV